MSPMSNEKNLTELRADFAAALLRLELAEDEHRKAQKGYDIAEWTFFDAERQAAVAR